MTMSDPQIERAAQVLYPLLYEHAPEIKITEADQSGPFAKPIKLLLGHHRHCAQLSAQNGRLYDAWGDCQSIWEGLRADDDGTKQYGLLDQEIRRIAVMLDNDKTIPLAPAPPKATNGAKDYVVDWRQQGISAADLQRKIFDALTWIIDGILPEGATLLAGKPKSKKSWLALAAAVAVAMAGKVLGYYDVHQGEVLYLDLESNQRRMKSRLNSLIGSVAWPASLHIFTEWPRGQDGIMALDQWILAYPHTKLIVIDILQNFRPRRNPKADPYDQDYEAVKMINEFAERHRIAVLIIHHTRKAKADDVFDEISGTTGLSGGVASMWVLGRSPDNSGESILAIRGRDISDDDPMAIKWDNYSCQFVRVASGQEVSSGAARRQVLDTMDETSEYQLKEIAAAIQKSVSATSNLIRRLMDDGLIQRTGNGRYARIPQKPPYLSESRESRESDVKHESDVSLESDHSQETFTLHEDVKVDVKVVQPLSEQANDNFHDFHADLYRDAQSNIIPLDIIDEGIFSKVPPSKRTFLRLYLRGTVDKDQDRARELCKEYGLDYEQARKEANQ